jgi:hypothetical protein
MIGGEFGSIRHAGRNAMKRFYAILAVTVLATFGGWVSPVHAAPPTVTPSPGYDARLQEQRSAPVISQPEAPAVKPAPRRRLKRTH